MLSKSGNKESSLVSAGYDAGYIFEPTAAYAVQKGNAGFIIDAPGGINQDVTMDIREKGTDANLRYRNDIAFPGGVRPEYIKGVFKMVGGTVLQYEANPNYQSTAPQPDEFDLVLSAPQDDLLNPFSAKINVEPRGQQIGGIAYRYKKGTVIKVSIENGNNDYCWHVNTSKRGVKGDTLILNSKADEPLPVEVVWHGECGNDSSATATKIIY